MRALTVLPGTKNSLEVQDWPEPDESEGSVLVQGLELGLCGTDRNIVAAEEGEAPEGSDRLVIGHENLGRSLSGAGGIDDGELVIAFVRRPDPVPCPACARGAWDLCQNDRYTEHGIKGRHGFGRERWRADPESLLAVPEALRDVGVLLEPTTVVAKAWEQVDRIASRSNIPRAVAAVTGAGPVGLLAALLARQRGLEVHVFDIVTSGPKPDLVARLGATYHSESLPDSGVVPDVVLEGTGVSSVTLAAMTGTRPDGICCLAGVSAPGKTTPVDVAAFNRSMVFGNRVVFGSVNAARRHYVDAVDALAAADQDWLAALITRRVPLEQAAGEAFAALDSDVKVVVELKG